MPTPRDPHSEPIEQAVSRLLAGRLVAFPTETVYGLGADASNARGVAAIFEAKGRPADHPLIVHIAEPMDMDRWAAQIPPAARALAARYWPGPLTLILPRAAWVSDAVTGGQDSIGLRCPAHRLAHRLLVACRGAGIAGLAAPSANRFGRVSPTTAAHVRAEFGTAILVLDGGACTVGIESTIVDVTNGGARVLRPGMIPAQDIARCVGAAATADTAAAPRVPGALVAHYAPATPLELLEAGALLARAAQLAAAGRRIAVFAADATLRRLDIPTIGVTRVRPETATGYARALYATLRELDSAGADCILVEMPPRDAAWDALHDRLRRAAVGAGRPPS